MIFVGQACIFLVSYIIDMDLSLHTAL